MRLTAESTPHPSGPGPHHRRSVLVQMTVLGVILTAGSAFRLDGLADRPFWFDEAYAWRTAQYSPGEIWDRLRSDNSPPLYWTALRYWMGAFGESPAALRSFSVVSGLAAVVGVWLFVRELLAGPLCRTSIVSRQEIVWGPLLAAALVALSPIQVRYSWECRMYAMGVAFATFSSWAMVRAMDPDRPRWGRWLVFAGIATLFAYTHAFATLTIAAQVGIVGWWLCEQAGGSPRRVIRQPSFGPAVAAFAAVAVAFVPWVPNLLHQSDAMLGLGWIPPLTTYHQVLGTAFQLVAFDASQSQTVLADARMGLVLIGFVALAIRRGRWAGGVPLALFLGPVLLAIGLCFAGKQVFLDRYLIFAQPFLLAVIAVSIARIRHPVLLVSAAITVVTVSAYWCADASQHMDLPNHPGHRGAARYLDDHRAPGDVILCGRGNSYFPVLYHLADRSATFAVTQPEGWVAGDWMLDKPREVMRDTRIPELRVSRAWVVNHLSGNKLVMPVPVPTTWTEVSRVSFPDVFRMETVVVTEYRLPAPQQP